MKFLAMFHRTIKQAEQRFNVWQWLHCLNFTTATAGNNDARVAGNQNQCQSLFQSFRWHFASWDSALQGWRQQRLRDIIKMWNVSSLLPIYIQTCDASVACVISLIRSWKESSVSKLMADQSIIWWIWMNDLASERTINKRLIYQETQKGHNIAIKTNCLNSWSRIRVHGRCKRWICMRHAWWTGSWL